MHMIDRKTLDERGVFVSDMGDVSDRLNEIHSTLRLMIDRVNGHADDLDLLFGLQGSARTLLGVMSDLNDLEEVLTERGAIVTAEEFMRRKREAEAAKIANLVRIDRKARRTRKAVAK